jgi:hypothetical protein
MKSLIAILILILAAASPAAAKCACSSGGGASYNFLGDSAVDINMDGYDEFIGDNVPASSAAVPEVQTAAQSLMSLNLNDKSSIYLVISKTTGSLSGQGNMSAANGTETVEAVGTLEGDKLSLDVTASGGELYKFNLASEGSTVMGDFSETLPNGENLTGLAEGKWEI